MKLHGMRLVLIACLLTIAVGCGNDSANDAADPSDGTAASGADSDNGSDALTPGDAGTVSPISDCEAFREAAITILDETSLSADDRAPAGCQFFDQADQEGLSGRLFVHIGDSISPDMDLASFVLGDPSKTYVESEVDGWSVSAETSYSEPDPDFPESSTERVLALGGNGIEGMLTCRLIRSQLGDAGDEPPAPPTIDEAAFEAFCNEAKDALFTE